jgi:hypothetical protein
MKETAGYDIGTYAIHISSILEQGWWIKAWKGASISRRSMLAYKLLEPYFGAL